MAAASEARRAGQNEMALERLRQATASDPRYAPAWNLMGVIALERRDPTEAARCFQRALDEDPEPPFAWANLARARAALGDRRGELAALEQALQRDPYLLPALLAKGEALRALGEEDRAARHLRQVLAGLDGGTRLAEPLAGQVERARAWLRERGAAASRRHAEIIAGIEAQWPGSDLRRARGFADERAGLRKVYLSQPTDGFFPYLPALEYFDRSDFPWFERLEAQTDAIRGELLSLWAEDHPAFRAYVAYAPGTPTNQWAELNHSTRWSAWFLWENGVRNDAHCARCPATAAAIEALPLLDVPGKGPTVMFSILQPHTRIPAHTGSTNTRTTVHLPLVVPPGCGFRVGSDTRQWREGEAWAFDDTIEHEAWNDSDNPRAILILDTWNPLLSEPEKALVRAIG